MAERLSVGTSFKHGAFITLLIVTPIFFIVAVLNLLFGNAEFAPYFLGIGLIFVLLCIVYGTKIARGRRWLTATSDGFVLLDKRGEFEFQDEQITDLGTWSKVRYANGNPKAITRKGTLVLEAGEFRAEFPFTYEFVLHLSDPLEAFLERNINRLVKNGAETLERGGALHGTGWSVTNSIFTIQENRKTDEWPIAELTAIEIVDGKVCVWVKNNPSPVCKLPAGSHNALVLCRLMSERVAKQQTAEADTGLGRIIFERDKSITRGSVIVLVICCIFLFVGAILCFIAPTMDKTLGNEPYFVGAAVLALAALLVAIAWLMKTNCFRCHTMGVSYARTIEGERTMRFADMRVFSYAATRMYTNGAYTGTTLVMTFETSTGKKDRIKYTANIRNADDELDNLREHISQVLAGYMLKRLQMGKSVIWTDRVRFTRRGLEIVGKSGVFRKGEDLFIPYAQILDAQVNAGFFYLFQHGNKKQIYDSTVNTPNFFPGFYLLQTIRYDPTLAAVQRAPDGRTSEEEGDPE